MLAAADNVIVFEETFTKNMHKNDIGIHSRKVRFGFWVTPTGQGGPVSGYCVGTESLLMSKFSCLIVDVRRCV